MDARPWLGWVGAVEVPLAGEWWEMVLGECILPEKQRRTGTPSQGIWAWVISKKMDRGGRWSREVEGGDLLWLTRALGVGWDFVR